jgi:hypothetical protein
MLEYFRSGRRRTAVRTIVVAACMTGCSTSGFGPEQPGSGVECIDDTKSCIDERQVALKSLLADRNRDWIRQPASPLAYASGVRLFAYRVKRRELTCDELTLGRREADAAPAALRGLTATRLSTAQIARGSILAAEVGRELTNEFQRRCKA